MNNRREFLKSVALSGVAIPAFWGKGRMGEGVHQPIVNHRTAWVDHAVTISRPVLESLAANRLKLLMPVESVAGREADRRNYTYLEAFGRTLCGIAPWLELIDKPVEEKDIARQMAAWARAGLDNATNPESPDCMNFTKGGQPLVDTAFLALALLRAPQELWGKLDERVKKQIVKAFQSTRSIKPGNNNWLLFSAMVEAFLVSVGAEWKEEPIDLAVTRHESWYKGDGTYGDGQDFHWDYYNSFVIQPFLLDILETINDISSRWNKRLPEMTKRAVRYAAIQEMLIAPDGSFPAIGRSIAYRCGAFHLLARMSLKDKLPHDLHPAQVRCALTAVMEKTLSAPGTYDRNGWLRIGLCGHQPGLGETYISTGSLYLCTFAFLPLGLPVTHSFWDGKAMDWSSRRTWSGGDHVADHAL